MLHLVILKIFLLISSLLVLIILALAYGIEIPKIELTGFKIEQFYIKLDKKLIISIKDIKIESKKNSSSRAGEMGNIVKVIQYLPRYFQKVKIDNFQIDQNRISLLYDNNTLYIDTDIFQLSSTYLYNPKSKVITANINKLHFKDLQIALNGQFKYIASEKKWTGHGEYKAFKIAGNFFVTFQNDVMNFKLNSKETSSIKELVDYIPLPEKIKAWIYPKTPAKRYKLHYITGSIKINKDKTISFDSTKLKAFVSAYDSKIYFNKALPPVYAKQIDIALKNNTLFFKPYDPVHEEKRLNGSFVQIRNLTNKKAKLDVHIVVDDKIDNSIKTILSSYNINLPFVQTQGKTKAVVDFTIKLATGDIVKYKGDYRSKSATFLFNDTIKLPIKNLHAVFKDSKIAINSCNINLFPYLDATVSGSIDIYTKKGDFNVSIKKFQYNYNFMPIVEIENQKFPIKMSFDDKIVFEVPNLNLIFSYESKDNLKIVSKSLMPVATYFKGLLLPIKDGKVKIDYSSKKIQADGFLNYSNDFFSNNNKLIEKFSFQIEKDKLQTTAILNNNIFITSQKNRTFIDIKDIDIQVDKVLKAIKPYTKKRDTNSKHTLHFRGKNSTLYYKSIQLPCTSFSAILKTNPLNFRFITKHSDGEIRGIVSNGYVNVTGKQLPDYVIRNITTLDYIHGGFFDFDMVGGIDNFKGTIFVHNSLWAKDVFYNNLLATLNTIPAVLMLKNPGFSNKGFKIKEGAIEYHYQNNELRFDNILINSDSAQITGRGKLNLNSQTILMLMHIHFLENLANILNKIPVAGYLIFGDDGTMAVTLNISGYLDNPKVTTETVKDVIKVPLNILDRVLTLPFKLFE